MKHLILWLSATLLAAVAFGGCTKYVVRDPVVYQTELNQYDAWATKQAELLRGFVTDHCVCTDGKFTDKRCGKAADFILTVETRAAPNKERMLILAGIKEGELEETPPAIPLNSTLCLPTSETPEAPKTEGGE